MSLLDGEIAATIDEALEGADLPLDIVVKRNEEGVADPPWEPPPIVEVDYPARGFEDSYTVLERAQGSIQAGDVKVVIIANSIAIEPQPGDIVVSRGKTYVVIRVSSDPARALFELQGRV